MIILGYDCGSYFDWRILHFEVPLGQLWLVFHSLASAIDILSISGVTFVKS